MISKTDVFKYLSYFLFFYKYFEDNVPVQVAPHHLIGQESVL